MRNTLLLLCAAAFAFGADDPWAKLKEVKSGAELRVYKKGTTQPLLVQMGELTDENLVVIDKKQQTAIARDQIDRVDARPSAKSRVTKETVTKETLSDPKSQAPTGMNGNYGPTTQTSTSTNTNLVFSGKPDFETVYRRAPSSPKK